MSILVAQQEGNKLLAVSPDIWLPFRIVAELGILGGRKQANPYISLGGQSS